jgi:putative addiction module component (TIGR02574 family)
MARTIDEVLAIALELSEDDRIVLAEELKATVPPDPGYEKAWSEEIERRLQDLDSGRATAIPAEEVFRKLRKKSQ